MRIPENLLHQSFNRLTAIGIAGRDKHGDTRWLWLCDCGVFIVALAYNVKSGNTKSCGCRNREVAAARRTTHGARTNGMMLAGYNSWQNMNQRCGNPNNKDFAYYGGRGITVCERWLHSFENFLADMGKRPDGLTLERKDNDQGYSPDNCKWATRAEQNRNKRSKSEGV